MNYVGILVNIRRSEDILKKVFFIVVMLLSISSVAYAAEPVDKSIPDELVDLTSFEVWGQNLNGNSFYGSKQHNAGTVITDGDDSTRYDIFVNRRAVWTKFIDKASGERYYANIFKFRWTGSLYRPDLYPMNLQIFNLNDELIQTIPNVQPNMDYVIQGEFIGGISLNSNITNTDPLSGEKFHKIHDIYLYGNLVMRTPLNPEEFKVKSINYVVLEDGSVRLQWSNVNSPYLKQYKVMMNDEVIATTKTNQYTFSKDQLTVGQTNVFKVVSIDPYNVEYSSDEVSLTIEEPDTEAPEPPTSLKVIPDRYSAELTWTSSISDDAIGYYVYLNGSKVTQRPVEGNSYSLSGLEMETEYVVYITAVDRSGNISEFSKSEKFTTKGLEFPPSAVTLSGTPYNGSASLSWTASQGATSYDVYQDDVKIGTTDKTFYKIDNLVNDAVYNFKVIAKSALGDSDSSNLVVLTPNEKLLPAVSLGYGLQDVTNGTSSWFSSIWLILAFSISIPLAFYIANRVKGLFVS